MAAQTEVEPTVRDTSGFFGHPKGLGPLFFTELWERFSYYGMRSILILYMTSAVAQGGLAFDTKQASAIYGWYTMAVYLTALPGGWIADHLTGARIAVLIGGIIIAFGHFSMIFHSMPFVFVGMGLIALGTGLLKPNISVMVGNLYRDNDPRRDSGFSIFYMGINVGAFLGQLVTGYLGERVDWHVGMGAAGVAMLLGLANYGLRAKKTLGPIGTLPTRHPDPAVQAKQERNVKTFVVSFIAAVVLLFALTATGAIELDAAGIAKYMTYAMVTMAAVFFAFVFVLGKLSGEEKKRVAVIVVLFVFAAIFWSAFEQAPTALNLFARDFTRRTVGGFEIPATWFQSVNPLLIIVCAPMLAALWVGLAKGRGDLSAPAKFSLGLFLSGIGFMLMIFAANQIVASGGTLLVSPWWLVGSYFFQSIGELCLSPVGLSSMTKLSPRKYVGQMMGIWFLASALGNVIGGRVGGHVDPEKLDQMPKLFTTTTLSLMIAAGILALLIVPIRRMMRDDTNPLR